MAKNNIKDDEKIFIADETGKEIECRILFTFVPDDSDVQYVFFVAPEDEEDVIVGKYDDEGNLEIVIGDNKEEWEMIEEVFNAFLDEPEDEEA